MRLLSGTVTTLHFGSIYHQTSFAAWQVAGFGGFGLIFLLVLIGMTWSHLLRPGRRGTLLKV